LKKSFYYSSALEGLVSVVNILKPTVEPYSFTFSVDENALSSGGPFANGFFNGKYFRIGIIYRKLGGSGSVIYENEMGNASHDQIMSVLGHGNAFHFRFNSDLKVWSVYAVDGGDPLDALVYDWIHFAPPLYIANKTEADSIMALAIKNRNH
jgi:hypothetical protein